MNSQHTEKKLSNLDHQPSFFASSGPINQGGEQLTSPITAASQNLQITRPPLVRREGLQFLNFSIFDSSSTVSSNSALDSGNKHSATLPLATQMQPHHTLLDSLQPKQSKTRKAHPIAVSASLALQKTTEPLSLAEKCLCSACTWPERWSIEKESQPSLFYHIAMEEPSDKPNPDPELVVLPADELSDASDETFAEFASEHHSDLQFDFEEDTLSLNP